MQKIHISETGSTNTFLLNALKENPNIEEGFVIYTSRQTAGRGQIGNTWESEFDKNICFSILLRPKFLPIKEQFLLSEITSLAVTTAIRSCLPEKNTQSTLISIKWPNDIYIGDNKVCGMLIENSLMGCEITTSVIGVGININQTQWIGNAPNPTSLKLVSGRNYSIEEILNNVCENIWEYYVMLKEGKKGVIHRQYLSHIYRRDGFHQYKDAESGKLFMAKIKEVEPSGYLLLEDSEGSIHRYMFKEVKFVLPCGITKE